MYTRARDRGLIVLKAVVTVQLSKTSNLKRAGWKAYFGRGKRISAYQRTNKTISRYDIWTCKSIFTNYQSRSNPDPDMLKYL